MDFDDVVYKRRIVDMLNTIVMTTSELHSLRIRLKDMKTEVRCLCGVCELVVLQMLRGDLQI